MVEFSTLGKLIVYGGFAVGFTGLATRYSIEKRIRQTITYKKALDIFYNHEKAVKYLGEPIKEGRINFDYRDENIKKFSINMKGANTKGKLDCEYNVLPDLKTQIRKVQIRFDDLPDKVYVLHELQ